MLLTNQCCHSCYINQSSADTNKPKKQVTILVQGRIDAMVDCPLIDFNATELVIWLSY